MPKGPKGQKRKAAQVLGLAWMAAVAILGAAVLIKSAEITLSRYPGFYVLTPLLFICGIPGALLFRWGRGPYMRPPTVKELLRPKAPYDRAAEAGHVMKTDIHA